MKYSVPLATVVVLALTQPVSAQSPERLAQRCVEYVNQIVNRCANAAADETHECIRTIEALLAEGNYERAREVAAECIRSATARTEHAAGLVESARVRCVNALLEMGAEELARRVSNACDDAIEQLRHLLQREKNAILDALEG